MKIAHLFFPLALASTTLANKLLRRQDLDPEKPIDEYNGPEAWMFTLQSWSGDGCPDFNNTNATKPNYMNTRQSDGPFMFNSSADTFWAYFAFPYMEVHLPPNGPSRMARVVCDLTVLYEQTNEYGGTLKDEEKTHVLRLHKNGSLVEANYKLDKGVNAEWQVRLLDTQDFTVMAQDWSSIDGPIEVGDDQKMALEWLPPLYTPDPFLQVGCGKSIFRIRFDLWLAGRNRGAGGTVQSQKIDYNNGAPPQVHGVNLGFSYDWEKC